MKIFIWSCGKNTKTFIDKGFINIDNISGFIDNNIELKEYIGKKVYLPENIKGIIENIDYIIVTTYYAHVNKEIYEQAVSVGIPDSKLVFVNNYCKSKNFDTIHNQPEDIFEKIMPGLAEYAKAQKENEKLFVTSNKCAFDKIDTNLLISKKPFDSELYLDDYFRYRTFELVANQILENNIKGNVAELGVFKGTFSKLINAKFPDKKLYLYDSFESFNKEEFLNEVENGNCENDFFDGFTNTSVSIATSNMKYPENLIIRKGYFPESLEKEDYDEKFAFVSLDVDFEESTFSGLEFFYPRLAEGGYIFLHDYNNEFLQGVKKAVDRYSAKINQKLKIVPIADQGGTLVIAK